MVDASETKRNKARQLRYRKAIVKDLNLDAIKEELCEISGACDDVKWYWEGDDDTLINALDGDEEEAYEFKMLFGDLCAECEQMREDLYDEWNYIPECFDIFFVVMGAGGTYGGLLGWDSYEQDYFGIDGMDCYAEDESAKKLKQMTKDQLIQNARHCFKIYQAYIGIRHRYDCLKAALDILRDENTGYLQMVKQIEETYEKAAEEKFYDWKPGTKEFNKLVWNMPQEAWIQ